MLFETVVVFVVFACLIQACSCFMLQMGDRLFQGSSVRPISVSRLERLLLERLIVAGDRRQGSREVRFESFLVAA